MDAKQVSRQPGLVGERQGGVKVIYTAIFGKIDRLQELDPWPGWDYVCFTDREGFEGRGWEIRPPGNGGRVPRVGLGRRMARFHKVSPHELFPGAQITLWVDGCLAPRVNPESIAHNHLARHDLATFKHGERSCLYQELQACIRLKKDVPGKMQEQVGRYRREGYPPGRGLAETTAVLSRLTPPVIELYGAWWHEIVNGSVRDQLSLDYCCWKLGLEYDHLKGSRTKSPYFRWRPHR